MSHATLLNAAIDVLEDIDAQRPEDFEISLEILAGSLALDLGHKTNAVRDVITRHLRTRGVCVGDGRGCNKCDTRKRLWGDQMRPNKARRSRTGFRAGFYDHATLTVH